MALASLAEMLMGYVMPPEGAEVVEGTRGGMLPVANYRLPDGRVVGGPAFPQPMADAGNAMAYALGYTQDPNAPEGYVSQEALQRGGEGLAGSAAVGGLAVGKAPKNAVGMFAGQRAKTADLDALKMAQALKEQGAPRESIWTQTGWFEGPDGKWRFEIDDSKARLRRRGETFGEQWSKMPDDADADLKYFLQHRDLEAAYPAVANKDVEALNPRLGYDGWFHQNRLGFAKDLNRDDLRTTMLHEGNHAIEPLEDFARQGLYQKLTDDEYDRLGSEVLSRAVEARRDLTPEQRRARPPWLDYDVDEGNILAANRSQAAAPGQILAQKNSRGPGQPPTVTDLGRALVEAEGRPRPPGSPPRVTDMARAEMAQRARDEADRQALIRYLQGGQ